MRKLTFTLLLSLLLNNICFAQFKTNPDDDGVKTQKIMNYIF